MDPRFLGLISRQQDGRFGDLAGSDVHAVIRVSSRLLNEAIGTYAPATSAVREIVVNPRAGNQFDVRVKLARAFLPALSLSVAVEQQPVIPASPVLALRVVSGGSMLRLAGPAVSSSGVLPPGVRLEGDRVFIDLATLLRARGQAQLLDFAQQLEVMTEEGVLVLLIHARVP